LPKTIKLYRPVKFLSSEISFVPSGRWYGDLYAQGVIDPAKLVRTALQDAASVAGLLVTNRGDECQEAEEGRRSSAARRRRHRLLISNGPAPSAGAGISEGRNDVWTDFERRCTSMRLCRQGDCSSKGIVKDPGAIASLTAFVARLYTRGMRDRDQPLTAAMQFVPMLPITPRELTPLLYAVQGDKGG
jgi:hypothetical protein